MGLFSTVKKRQVLDTRGKRVVLALGGSGVLGRALVAAKPQDVLFVNVSTRSLAEGDHVINYPFDLRGDLGTLFLELQQLLPHIDVLINLAYTKTFSSVVNLEKAKFLDEVYLDVAVPMLASRLCGEHFWAKTPCDENSEKRRKVINISSLSAFGQTARPELATYSGAKSMLNVMTEYLHEYLSTQYGVSAHVVAPGSLLKSQDLANAVSAVWSLVEAVTPVYSLQALR